MRRWAISGKFAFCVSRSHPKQLVFAKFRISRPSRIQGKGRREVALHGPVLSTVKHGGRGCSVMWWISWPCLDFTHKLVKV